MEGSVERSLASLVSSVGHPLLMPSMALLMLYVFDGFLVHRTALFAYLLVLLLINSAAPAASLWMLKRRGAISDVDMSNRKERPWPFLLVLAYQLMAWLLVHDQSQLDIPVFYQNLFLSLVVSIGLAWLVTLRFKVSMHMLAQGGLMAIHSHVVLHTGMLSDGWLALLILAAGLVGWSRLTLQAHSLSELYTGYAMGFISVWLTLF
jgi:hypothetical protein